jgi:hypothetical protein
MEPIKPEIIPEKILEEVRLRKHFAEQGIEVHVSRARRWGTSLANRLMNETEEAVLVTPKELPPSRA